MAANYITSKYSNVRIFNPFVYLFSDDLMMFQRIYNFVMKVAMTISLCEYEELRVYLKNTVGMNECEINDLIEIIREHTLYFVKIYKGDKNVYTKFILSSIYPMFYCEENHTGCKRLTNYMFGDQVPGGASNNMISIVDIDETFSNVMSSKGFINDGKSIGIFHFRSTFKNIKENNENLILMRFKR